MCTLCTYLSNWKSKSDCTCYVQSRISVELKLCDLLSVCMYICTYILRNYTPAVEIRNFGFRSLTELHYFELILDSFRTRSKCLSGQVDGLEVLALYESE